MWEPVVETLPAPAWFGTGVKLGYIFAVRLIETILGNVFIWSSSMFYSVYRHAPEWGITPAHDLNLGGIVMMAEGSIVTLARSSGSSCGSRPRASCASAARAGPRPAPGEARRALRPGEGPRRRA